MKTINRTVEKPVDKIVDERANCTVDNNVYRIAHNEGIDTTPNNNSCLCVYARYCMVPVVTMRKLFENCFNWKNFFMALSIIAAMTAPGHPLWSKEMPIEHIAGRIQEIYEGTADFRAEFVQEASIKSLGTTTSEEGTVYLKKPERMLWDYKNPSMKKLVINPQKAWLYIPDEKIVYVQDARQVLSSKMTIRFLTGIGRLSEDFDLAVPKEGPKNKDGDYLIALTPRRYEAGIKNLLLIVDKESFYIKGCVFTDLYDNTTRLTFSNIEFNTNPADEMFEFTPPEGIKVYNADGS